MTRARTILLGAAALAALGAVASLRLGGPSDADRDDTPLAVGKVAGAGGAPPTLTVPAATSPFDLLPEPERAAAAASARDVRPGERVAADGPTAAGPTMDDEDFDEEAQDLTVADVATLEAWLLRTLGADRVAATAEAAGTLGVDAGTAGRRGSGAAVRTDPASTSRDDADDAGTISGQVTTEDGLPIAGQEVTLEGPLGGEPRLRRTRSAAGGRFSIDDLPVGEYLLRATETELYGARTMRVRAGAAPVRLALALRGVVVVEGTVSDEDGVPIAGARVVPPVIDEAGVTDEDGRFAVELSVLEGRDLLLKLEAEGYLPGTHYFPVGGWRSDETLRADVRLRRVGVLALGGTVLGEDGVALERALVQLDSRNARIHQSVQTDASGRFSVEGLVPADDYALKISSPPAYETYRARGLAVEHQSLELAVTLPFSPRGRVVGTIVDPRGTPVPGMSLLASSEGASSRATTIRSDETGWFALEGFVAGDLVFRSQSPPSVEIRGGGPSPEQDTVLTLVVDVGGHTLSGTVVDERGSTVPGARLLMRLQHDEGGLRSTTTRSASSAADGSFAFTGLGAGTRSIIVTAPEHATERLTFDPAIDPGPHTVALAR